MPDIKSTYSIEMSSDVFRSLLFQAASSLIWKNQAEANKYDQGVLYYTECFMAAKRGVLTFELISDFDEELLSKVGLFGERALEMMVDKNKIPYDYRDKLVELFVERLTAKDISTGRYTYYQEENNYYRMLSGLPDIEEPESEYIYITDMNSPYPKNVPIHELPITVRIRMEQDGTLDKLLAEHPTKKYIKYLGKKGIDIYAARAADRFDILYLDSDQGRFERDFRDVYDQCKYTIRLVYYSKGFQRSNPLYENFMAYAILFMTVINMCRMYLTADISRDFYDAESVRYIYDSYMVPFYGEIPLEYHVKIAKEMNRLIGYKGSATVFYDLFNIFDMGNMTIYQYYLTKVHKFENNMPVFRYDANGNYKPREMFDIQFAKSDIKEDAAMQVVDPANYLAFPDLTYGDPYWVNDEDLFNVVFDEEYNYAETKYIGIQAVLDVLGNTYENAYFLKLLQDNREAVNSISTQWSVTNEYVSLFDFFCYLAAIYCKKYGFEGSISTRLPVIGRCLGYDFKNELYNLQELVAKDPYLGNDNQLQQYILSMNCDSLASVNETFSNIINLRKYLVTKMTEVHDRKEFETYRRIYEILLTSENIEDSFRKTDGTIAESYEDLLADQDPTLFNRYLELDVEDIDNEALSVIAELERMIPRLRTLRSLFGFDVNYLVEALFKMLQFFKSAKADLIGYDIVFMLSYRGINFFKLIDELDGMSDEVELPKEYLRPTDILERIQELLSMIEDSMYLLKEKYYNTKEESILEDYIKWLVDELYIEAELWKMTETLMPFDDVSAEEKTGFGDKITSTDALIEKMLDILEPKYHGNIDESPFNPVHDELGNILEALIKDDLIKIEKYPYLMNEYCELMQDTLAREESELSNYRSGAPMIDILRTVSGEIVL